MEEGGDDGGGGGESAHCESEERTSASVAATGARRKRKVWSVCVLMCVWGTLNDFFFLLSLSLSLSLQLFTQPSSLSSRDPQPGAATSTRPSPSPSPSPPLTHKRKCRTRFPCSSSSKGKCPLRKAKKKKTLSAQEEPADSATAALLQALEEAALGLPGTQLDGIPGCSDRGNHMRSRLRPPQAKKSRRDSAAITSCEGAQVTRTAPSIGGQVDMDTSEKRTECISSANTEVSSSQTTRDLLAEDTKHPPVHKPPQTLRLAVGARKPAKDVEESLGMQLECAATAVIEETPRLEIGRRTCGRMVAGGDRSTISKSVRIAPRRDGLASAVDVRVIQETPFIRISRTGSASGEGETEPLVVSIPVSCFKRGQKMTRECVEETPLVRAVNEVGGGAGGVDVLLAAEEVEPGGQVCAEQREEEEGFQNGSSSEGEVLSGSQHGSSSDSDRTPLLPRSPPAHCDPNLLTPVAASSRTHRATGSLSGHIPLDSSGSTTPDLCMPSPPSPSPPSSSPSISPSLFISRQNPSNALPRRFSFNPSVEQQPAVAPSNPTPHLDTSFSPCVPLQNTHHNATARCTVGDGDRSRYLTPDFLCSKVAETQLGTQSSCVNSSQNSPENRPRALLLGLPTLHALRVEKHTSPPVFTTKFFSNERQSPDLSGPGTGNVSSREDIETETRCEEKEEEEERMRTEEIAPPAQPPLRPAATEEGALSVQLSLAVGAPASSPLSQPPSTVPGSVSVVPDSLCPNDTSQTGDCCADIHDTVRTPLLRGQPPAQVNSDLCVSPHNQTRGCLSCTDECLTPTCTLTLTATETGRVTCGDVSQYYSSSSSGVSLSGGLTMTSQDLDALKLQMEQKQSEIAELEALLVREKAADESPDRGRMTPEEGLPLLALTGQAMLCCNTTADGREASLEECPPNYPNCGSEAEEDIFEVIRQSQHEVMVIPESLPNHTPFSSPDHIYFSTGNHTPLLQKPGSGGAVELVEDSAVVNAAALEEVKPEELSETIAHHSAVPIRAPPPRVAAAAPEPHVPPTETTDDSRWKSARKTKTTSTATSTASNVSVSRQRNGNPNSHHRNRDLALMKKSSRSSDEKKKFLCELSPGQNAMLPPTPDGDSVSPALLQMADRLIRSLRSPPLVITDRQTCIDIDRDLISSTGTRLSRSVQQRTAWKQNPRGSNKKGKCGAEENVSVQESENGDVNKRIQLMKPSNTTATRSSGSVQQGPLKSLTGLSDSQNLIGYYEKHGIQLRLAYNQRDGFLQSLDQPSGGSEPTFVEDYHQFDFSGSYDFNEHLTVFFEGTNITGEETLKHGRYVNHFLSAQDTGARYALGVRGSF